MGNWFSSRSIPRALKLLNKQDRFNIHSNTLPLPQRPVFSHSTLVPSFKPPGDLDYYYHSYWKNVLSKNKTVKVLVPQIHSIAIAK